MVMNAVRASKSIYTLADEVDPFSKMQLTDRKVMQHCSDKSGVGDKPMKQVSQVFMQRQNTPHNLIRGYQDIHTSGDHGALNERVMFRERVQDDRTNNSGRGLFVHQPMLSGINQIMMMGNLMDRTEDQHSKQSSLNQFTPRQTKFGNPQRQTSVTILPHLQFNIAELEFNQPDIFKVKPHMQLMAPNTPQKQNSFVNLFHR